MSQRSTLNDVLLHSGIISFSSSFSYIIPVDEFIFTVTWAFVLVLFISVHFFRTVIESLFVVVEVFRKWIVEKVALWLFNEVV